jgi:hypothetical protein
VRVNFGSTRRDGARWLFRQQKLTFTRKVVEWSTHGTWNLTVPIEFLRCNSLSKNLSAQESQTLESLDPEAVAQRCGSFPWCAPPQPPKRNTKRPRPNDEAEPPSDPGNVDNLGYTANLDKREMSVYALSGGRNVDGDDDWDAEESASWCLRPTSCRKETSILYLLVCRYPILIEWRSLAS